MVELQTTEWDRLSVDWASGDSVVITVYFHSS